MLEGSTIRLRSWHEDDLAILVNLRNDVALQAQLLTRVRGSSTHQVREWLKSRSDLENGMLLIIAKSDCDRAMGFVQISSMDALNCRAELGICLVKQEQGNGYGQDAIALLLSHLRKMWGIRKLVLSLRADNLAAYKCYKKIGFEQCGLYKKHIFIEGNWHDIMLMEYFLESEV